MTPPPLPGKTYYRTSSLGSGACGSVVLCYDDDGNEGAAKIFPFWDADGDECDENVVGLDCCVLREIAMLRLLNGAHPNLMRITDISEVEGQLCFVMPKMAGSLAGAIEAGGLSNKEKLRVAALSLHTLSFLHSFDIIHRDIK